MSDWSKLKVVDLKAELKKRDLPQHGLKAELVARLMEADAGGEGTEELEEAPVPTEDSPVEAIEPAIPEPNPEVAAPAPNDTVSQVPEPTDSPEAAAPQVESQTSAVEEQKPVDLVLPAETSNVAEQPSAPAEAPIDPQRQRRSASPPLKEQDIARRRSEAENGTHDNGVSHLPAEPASETMEVDEPPVPAAVGGTDATSQANETAADGAMDIDHDVAPSQHAATNALYICELMRPLRPNEMQAHLATLAAAPGQEPSESSIVNFHLDQIRTHAFVTFPSANEAARVRNALHDRVWPNESNRKPLKVDFVPAEKIASWIETEESSGGGRSGARWEISYEQGPDGVEARLVEAGRGNPKPAPPPRGPASFAGADAAIPTGPRGNRDLGPPSGPRGRPDRSPVQPSDGSERTRARPSVSFSLVPEELARRRLDNMQSFYTKDSRRPLGREINRYSFENGDSFVDRGKEIFEGIRPPHRERAVERDRRQGGGGRGGGRGRRRGKGSFRPRSDRYLPGLSGDGPGGRGGGGGGGGGGGFGRGGGRGGRKFSDDRGLDWDMDRAPRF